MLQVIEELKYSHLSLPQYTFESFWQFFHQNYAFFEERNILDWEERYQQYRPSIDSSTSDKTLYLTFRKMLKDFGDGHVGIETAKSDWFAMKRTPILKEMIGYMLENEIDIDELIKQFFNITDKMLAQYRFHPTIYTESRDRAYPIFAYTKTDSVGYLRFSRCWLNENINQEKDLAMTLESIFKFFAEVKTLIVDVRFNQGGERRCSRTRRFKIF